jgi:RNA-directed DNA polymerase
MQDIKKYYHDQKLLGMLERIITNPIETPRGYKNPVTGIALRRPLSQFFSGIYLKPVDDALSKMKINYLPYQDDILILCNTKRQLNRCWRKLLDILNERRLSLSHKKTRRGKVSSGFHFLGVYYAPTQPENNTTVMPVNDVIMLTTPVDQKLCYGGGVK